MELALKSPECVADLRHAAQFGFALRHILRQHEIEKGLLPGVVPGHDAGAVRSGPFRTL